MIKLFQNNNNSRKFLQNMTQNAEFQIPENEMLLFLQICEGTIDQPFLLHTLLPASRTTVHNCYVAVCNNYAICHKLQTALNCNAVCNTSYFKLRCGGNAICNVLQIASKFYHLKILKRRKKIDQRQNASLQSYLTMNSARHQSIRARHAKLPINTTIVQNAILPPHFCEMGGGGALKPICPSVYWFVCPSLCLSKSFNIAHIFWSIKYITLMFGMNDPWKKSFQLALCRNLCFDLGLLQGQFILPARGQQLSEFACKINIYTVI